MSLTEAPKPNGRSSNSDVDKEEQNETKTPKDNEQEIADADAKAKADAKALADKKEKERKEEEARIAEEERLKEEEFQRKLDGLPPNERDALIRLRASQEASSNQNSATLQEVMKKEALREQNQKNNPQQQQGGLGALSSLLRKKDKGKENSDNNGKELRDKVIASNSPTIQKIVKTMADKAVEINTLNTGINKLIEDGKDNPAIKKFMDSVKSSKPEDNIASLFDKVPDGDKSTVKGYLDNLSKDRERVSDLIESTKNDLKQMDQYGLLDKSGKENAGNLLKSQMQKFDEINKKPEIAELDKKDNSLSEKFKEMQENIKKFMESIGQSIGNIFSRGRSSSPSPSM